MASGERKPLRDYNLFFFDCETGGLKVHEADMVEVGCILTDPTGRTVIEEYSAKVFPKKPVQTRAAEVNGYTPEKWAAEAVELDGPMFQMIRMARNAIFTAHNTPFDWAFFEKAMDERYMKWPSDYHRWDTVSLAVPLLYSGRVPNLKLETLAAYFGIEHVAHRALGDVRATREVFLRLMELQAPVMEALRALPPAGVAS